ncbi:aromatic ring-hydroxylating oxygenase subunit alpha [Alicyclobacillus sp. ALC3]|uniref:aromatic ring-hydroxylating oxygenase subunit alpha n=1 Tax=Alicyclobacillus sp. ALC3 TaxID=2796143 RepID=UPI002378D068|nr:aromatic ring-hydroxylating dioxygenase subunit alpha [Alicyclobacillus sp. ALC3]WDL99509.1 aromatic ring-hydroxylating dioxygenase subunit alpha [Alicyclobacillus sp. ALC3]
MIDDAVLRREWVVALPSAQVNETPKHINLFGEPVVLWRSEGTALACRDLCVHRGAALSLGCVRDGALVCPYHGWVYAADGTCIDIPQLQPGTPITKKARLTSFGCTEAHGFVWVNLDAPQTPMFPLEGTSDTNGHHVIWGPRKAKAKPPRIIENFLDVGHLAILHDGFLGSSEQPYIPQYQVHRTATGYSSDEIHVFQPNADGAGRPGMVSYTYDMIRPLTVKFLKRDISTGRQMSIVLTVRPENTSESTVYGLMSFDYDTGLEDTELIAFQDRIFDQDLPIIESQKPEDLLLDLQLELSLQCDRVSIAYRQYLRELGVTFGVV